MSHDIPTKAQATRARTARATSADGPTVDAPTLYDADILLWSEQQAAVIRALGHRRDLPNDLDIANVAEEIESVGRSELATVKSQIRQILLHQMKLAIEPQSDAVRHWEGEIVTFHSELVDRYAPSMAQRIDIDAIWRSARDSMRRSTRGTQSAAFSAGLPETSPFGLDDLLGERIDPALLAARLQAPPSAPA
ncbi:DUF29 domain-containing protein [Rhodoplanes azumiensis]|uniref:DUF29 domain-containing protein n=1 Tax=Rhodoplanes azumiensis TaxID=1897628 RepID=A0ABW5ACN7_9BRAD